MYLIRHKDASAEADHPALLIADWKNQPATKPIVVALVPGDGEAAFLEQLGVVFFGLGPVEGVVPLVRRVAHAKSPDGLVADAALGQVVARDLCRAVVGEGALPALGHLLVQ